MSGELFAGVFGLVVEERMGRHEVLGDAAVDPQVDRGEDRARPVGLQGRCDPVRRPVVQKGAERQDSLVPDAGAGIDRQDTGEMGPLVPDLRVRE